MNQVKVKKAKILEALKKNRKVFKASYDIALEGYRLSVLTTLGGYMEEFKGLKLSEVEEFPPVPFMNSKPENHLEAFDVAISMLELEVDKVVVLTTREYRQYFLNKWDWYASWTINNTGNIGIGTDSPDSKFYVNNN